MKNKLTALVIGAGIIGRNHIKSLINNDFEVYVVDPVNPEIHESVWNSKLDVSILDRFDLIIISTTAKFHFEYVKILDANCLNKIVIIEKPLFCNESEFNIFNNLCINNNNIYFCNLPFFHNNTIPLLISDFSLGDLLAYNVSGSNWGMACNILHDISIIDSILNLDEFELFINKFKITEYISSKRDGYLEVFGGLDFNLNNINVSIRCDNNDRVNKIVNLLFKEGQIVIDLFFENLDLILPSNEIIKSKFIVPKASLTTGYICNELLNGNHILPYASKYTNLSLEIYRSFVNSMNNKTNLDFPFS